MRYGQVDAPLINRLAEHGLPVLLCVFPFLYLLPHPTLLLCACVGVWLVADALHGGARAFVPRDVADVCVYVFGGMLLLGGVLGYGRVWDGLVGAFLSAAYVPARHAMSVQRIRRRARMAALVSGTVCALYGIWQYCFGNLTPRWVDMRLFADIGGRVTSFFENPNVLAIYLLFLFPMALLGAADTAERWGVRLLYAFSGLAVGVCLVLTWTRGAWLGALLQILLLFLFYSDRSRKKLPFLILFASLLIPLLPGTVLRRLASIGSMRDSSVCYRFHTWRGVWRLLWAHPFGIGVGETAFRAVWRTFAVMGTETVMHAHNVFLQVAVELGFGGLVLFVWMLSALLMRVEWRGKRLLGGVTLCGLLVMGLFDHLWYAPGMLLPFWVACAACDKDMSAENDPERQKNVSILHEKF